MQSSLLLQQDFETRKNRKALFITLAVCCILLLFAFIIRWKIELPVVDVKEEQIEINLGNNDEGDGKTQPLIKGAMSEKAAERTEEDRNQTAAASTASAIAEDDGEESAAPVTKSAKTSIKKNSLSTDSKNNSKNNSPVAVNNAKKQTAIATYKGPGKDKGNNALQDNGFKYEGNKKDGKRDAGEPSGKPDSYGNDAGGKSGVTIVRGSRPLNLGQLRFEDDFNENARVYLDVKYNSAGEFINASVAKGTTTSNNTVLSIARRKAAALKFPVSENGGITTLVFNFKVHD